MAGQFLAFVKNAVSNLIKSGFSPIKSNGINNSNGESAANFYALIKNESGVLYIAAFYDASVFSGFISAKNEFLEQIGVFATEANARNIIIFQILVSGSHKEAVGFVDTHSEEYFSQNIYEINYFVPLDGSALYYSKKQPFDILNMHNILSKSQDYENNAISGTEYEGYAVDAFPEAGSLKPIKVENEILVYIILVINAFIFALMELNGGSQDIATLELFGAMSYYRIINFREYYRLFTSMFVHIGIAHLVYNSLSLYIFGQRVERYYGRLKFLFIYIVSGLAGSVATVLFYNASIAAGASGAIFGLMGSALALAQIAGHTLGGINYYTMLIFIITGVGYGFVAPNIGNAAHIGGLLCGYIIGVIICLIQKKQHRLEV